MRSFCGDHFRYSVSSETPANPKALSCCIKSWVGEPKCLPDMHPEKGLIFWVPLAEDSI